jgi:hypothetical protein
MVPGDVELHLGVKDDAARNAHPDVLGNDLDPLVAPSPLTKLAVTSGADLPGLRQI